MTTASLWIDSPALSAKVDTAFLLSFVRSTHPESFGASLAPCLPSIVSVPTCSRVTIFFTYLIPMFFFRLLDASRR